MAPANVQHRSIHITDIQQNIEIPEIYNEYPKPEQIKGESKIQNSSDVCCPGLTLYINTKRMVVINTEVTLHITKMHEYEFQKQIFPRYFFNACVFLPILPCKFFNLGNVI